MTGFTDNPFPEPHTNHITRGPARKCGTFLYVTGRCFFASLPGKSPATAFKKRKTIYL